MFFKTEQNTKKSINYLGKFIKGLETNPISYLQLEIGSSGIRKCDFIPNDIRIIIEQISINCEKNQNYDAMKKLGWF